MSIQPKTIGFALGGLAGNNAHGAGFLHGALQAGLEPSMISCTSGQIFWVYQYLLARTGDHDLVRRAFYKEIEELHRLCNINLDFTRVALLGRPGVFRPAYYEYPRDLATNGARAVLNLLVAPTRSFWAEELNELAMLRE
jgi:hypothetical protein